MLPLLKYNHMHKDKMKGILAGHTIAMVTHLATKIIATCSQYDWALF